jgi:hypothetical protein
MTARWLKSLVAILALEWQLCREDPFLFCYRMGVSLLLSHFGGSTSAGNNPS